MSYINKTNKGIKGEIEEKELLIVGVALFLYL